MQLKEARRLDAKFGSNFESKLIQFQSILQSLVNDQYKESQLIKLKCIVASSSATPVTKESGVYLKVILQKTGEKYTHATGKIGMAAFDAEDRTKNQGGHYAVLLLDYSKAKQLVHRTFVRQVLELELPGVPKSVHHLAYAERLVTLALAEMLLASCFPCLTKNVGEKLVILPSDEIMDAVQMYPRQFFRDEAIHRMSLIEDVKAFTTWPTLTERVLSMRSNSPFLQQMVVPCNRPKDTKFVGLHMLRLLYQTPPLQGFSSEDCIKESPREWELNHFIQQLRNTQDPKTIQAIFKSFKKNKSKDYVRPDSDTLAFHAMDVIETEMILRRDKRECKMVANPQLWDIERVTNDALSTCVHTEEWWNEIIGDVIEVGQNQTTRIQLAKAKCSDGEVLEVCIHPSYFTIYSEEINLTQRQNAAKDFMVQLCLLHHAGHVTEEQVQCQHNLLLTYLMDCAKGHARFGRTLCFPEGYFEPRCQTKIKLHSVSVALGLSEATILYICNALGEVEFDRIFRALGFMKYQPLVPTPLFWTTCPGVPSGELYGFPDIKGRPCNDPHRSHLSFHLSSSCIGQQNPKRLFSGCFVCRWCAKYVELQEKKILEAMSQQAMPQEAPQPHQQALQQMQQIQPQHQDRLDQLNRTKSGTYFFWNSNKRHEKTVAAKRKAIDDAELNPSKMKRTSMNHGYPAWFCSRVVTAMSRHWQSFGMGYISSDEVYRLYRKLMKHYLSREVGRIHRDKLSCFEQIMDGVAFKGRRNWFFHAEKSEEDRKATSKFITSCQKIALEIEEAKLGRELDRTEKIEVYSIARVDHTMEWMIQNENDLKGDGNDGNDGNDGDDDDEWW